MNVEQVKIDDLIPYANNARVHSADQISQIASSIKEFGFNVAVLIDKDNGIIAGHGRVEAAKKLKMSEVPCVRLEHLTETQKKAYILADNRIALNSTWDEQMLGLEMMALQDEGFDVSELGFELSEIEDFTNPVEPTEGLTDEDEVPEVPEEPKTKPGDIYQLGRHRLMCGDSTSIDAVEKLISGVVIDLIHTDPPYGINEKGMRDDRGGLTTNSKLPDFKDDSVQYAIDAFNLCQALGIKRQVWWGANYYAHAVPQTNNWLVWDKRVEDKYKDTQSDCELAWVKSKWSSIRIFRHVWKGMIKDSEKGQKRVHATQKPVALAEWVIDYYKDVKTVLDLFGGSGFNILACEKKGIDCYTMELMPEYCDVIVKRWEDFTGKKAELL